MKLATTVTKTTNKSIEIDEHFSHQDGVPCIDFVVEGYLVARQKIHKQAVGDAFRVINKMYPLPEPVVYDSPDKVDVSGIEPETQVVKSFISWVVPESTAKKTTPKPND
ncbi:MAG: hypothetical protein ACFB2W_00505 [Leptolyngbyaceae cyanobacterium]